MNATDYNTEARALINTAAALAGMTAEDNDHSPEPLPLPCLVIDPATGRRLHLRRATYPASTAGRIAIAPAWPTDSTGRSHIPRTVPSPATVAPTTTAGALARRLRRYMTETQDAHDEATARAAEHSDHATKTAATVAALVAAGWTPPTKHNESPTLPTLPGDAYGYREQLTGDRVSVELRGLTIAQALAITAAPRP